MSERAIVLNHRSICTVRTIKPFQLVQSALSLTKGAFMCNVMQKWRLCGDDFVECKCKIWLSLLGGWGDGREVGRCWGNDFSSDILQGHGSTLFLLLSKSALDIWDFMGCTIYAASSEAPSAEGPEPQRRPHGHRSRTCRTRDRWGHNAMSQETCVFQWTCCSDA